MSTSNYIRLWVARAVSVYLHCCVHTFGHDPGLHLFFHQFQFVAYNNAVTAAAGMVIHRVLYSD